jgi:hypothetical protein
MSQANDSITVTPGTGATVATHLIAGKEHQAIVQCDESGYILGTKPTYIINTGNSANVAAARTTHLDLFNATGSGKIITVKGIFIIPALAAVTGVGLTWEIAKSSTVGSGGTTKTPVGCDSTNPSIPAQVTCRSKPTGGATIGDVLVYANGSSEETNPYATQASQINHVPCASLAKTQEFILREDQGVKIDQTTSSAVGTTNIQVVFTME